MEQFETYEEALKAIDADYEISAEVRAPELVDGSSIDNPSCHMNVTLTLTSSNLVLSENYCYDGPDGTPSHVRQLTMTSGREGIAKLMFHFDIQVYRRAEGFIGELMMEDLFEKLSPLSIEELVKVFMSINISFNYKA